MKNWLKISVIPTFIFGVILVILGSGSLIIVWLEGGPNPWTDLTPVAIPLTIAGAGSFLIKWSLSKFKNKQL